jgi:hypothetical protein
MVEVRYVLLLIYLLYKILCISKKFIVSILFLCDKNVSRPFFDGGPQNMVLVGVKVQEEMEMRAMQTQTHKEENDF